MAILFGARDLGKTWASRVPSQVVYVVPSMLAIWAFVISAVVVWHAAPASAGTLTGGDPCSLLEGFPGPSHPSRKSGAYKKLFRELDRAGNDPKKMAAVHRKFTKKVSGLLRKSRRVFHPKGKRVVKANEAQRFLRRYVLGPHSALVIADDRFSPPPVVWSAIVWSACRGGKRDMALVYARRAAPHMPSMAALAALFLLDQKKPAQAREWLPFLKDPTGAFPGFLGPFVSAELSRSADARTRLHGLANRRVSTSEQARAIQHQAQRLRSPTPGSAKKLHTPRAAQP